MGTWACLASFCWVLAGCDGCGGSSLDRIQLEAIDVVAIDPNYFEDDTLADTTPETMHAHGTSGGKSTGLAKEDPDHGSTCGHGDNLATGKDGVIRCCHPYTCRRHNLGISWPVYALSVDVWPALFFF